ncbi:LuxR C-terminal-related transcriptional regulator, partial [Streptomyces melanogenes]|uniref:LuxR C-terminal-related transcriptional regulator n=1 Tax=Streptomyces melanogenes TaxID=67326 RepID=UPI00167D4CEF
SGHSFLGSTPQELPEVPPHDQALDTQPEPQKQRRWGYVLKQIKGTDLISAVRTVASGQSMLDPATTARLMSTLRGPSAEEAPAGDQRLAGLSEREREILDLIGEGFTNRQIGKRLYLSEKTVKNNISRLLAKLGVERRVQAAVIAAQLPPEDRHR